MRMCSIASGSSGNCIYVGSDTTHLLVDVGISGKRIKAGVEGLGITPGEVDGILITHEHADHIAGLGVISRSFGIPIYGTEGTIEAVKRSSSLGKIDPELFRVIRPDESFSLKDITVSPMHVSHDAADPVAYRMSYGGKRMAVITDLGVYDEYTIGSLLGMDVLLIEANHDINMLQVGPYPYPLKQRILGNRGHLCNEACGRLLSRLLHDGTKSIMLGHLSKENNMPELAYEAVRTEITVSDCVYTGNDFPIYVAKRDVPSEVLEI